MFPFFKYFFVHKFIFEGYRLFLQVFFITIQTLDTINTSIRFYVSTVIFIID